MRIIALLVSAGALALAAAIPAFAVTTSNGVTGKIGPSKGGSKKKPVGHKLFTEVTTTNDDGSQPPPVRTTILTYGREFDFNGKSFKSCSKKVLDLKGPTACPKGSKVGTGSSDALLGTQKLSKIPVTAFNGPGGNKIELYVGSPLQKTIEGVQKGKKGKPKTITFSVPKEAINPVGNTFSSIIRFGATLKATTTVTKKSKGKKKKVKVPYVQTSGCGKDDTIPLRAKFIYATKKEFSALPDELVSSTSSSTEDNDIACK
jgi:hypothetical protein